MMSKVAADHQTANELISGLRETATGIKQLGDECTRLRDKCTRLQRALVVRDEALAATSVLDEWTGLLDDFRLGVRDRDELLKLTWGERDNDTRQITGAASCCAGAGQRCASRPSETQARDRRG